MRVLFVITTRLGWSTYGSRLLSQAEADASNACEVRTYTPWQWGRRLSWQTKYNDRTLLHIPLLDPFTVTWLQGVEFRRRASEFDAVVVATQAIADAVVGNSAGTPVFCIIDATRGLYKDEFGASNIDDRKIERERALFDRCAGIFPLSRWVERDLVLRYRIPHEKIAVIPTMAQEPGVRRENIGQEEKIKLLFVGQDFIRKGGQQLLQAQRDGLHEIADLTVVTKDDYHENCIGTSWSTPVKNRVVTDELLPRADLLVHPTRRDCSAIVVAEAAMAGVPAITSRVGGVGDLVLPGQTGVVLDHIDASAIGEAVATLAGNRDLLKTMGERARVKALAEFAPRAVYERLLDEVCRRLAGKGG